MVESLGDYKILDRIGAGGMGEVFRARDTRLGRTVAIKVIGPQIADDPGRRERFLVEARAAATLSHPNIAALYEVGEDRGQLFLVFEFVPGESLKTVIGGRPLNPRRAIDLAVQVADALADGQAGGIIHRDIKPASIMVTPKGNAKILDFGLSTWTAGGAEREHAAEGADPPATPSGTAQGTVAYMSPEQALGEQLDHRTDIFSLGIVIFEMLTGRQPFSAQTPAALALKIVQAPAPLPSSMNRALPTELDPIVGKALAKSLEQRYESSVTLAAELRSVAAILDVRSDAAAPAIPHMTVQQPRRQQPRSQSEAGWIILLVILAALLAAAWFQRDAIERLLG
jgi:serine/threonine protein kinase